MVTHLTRHVQSVCCKHSSSVWVGHARMTNQTEVDSILEQKQSSNSCILVDLNARRTILIPAILEAFRSKLGEYQKPEPEGTAQPHPLPQAPAHDAVRVH